MAQVAEPLKDGYNQKFAVTPLNISGEEVNVTLFALSSCSH